MLKQSMENLRAKSEDLLLNKTNRPRARIHKPVKNGGRTKIDIFIRYTSRRLKPAIPFQTQTKVCYSRQDEACYSFSNADQGLLLHAG